MYRKLILWQQAIDLVEEIYKITENFPKQEQYGLTSQIRKAAVSVPSNIAEGATRKSRSEFSQFLYIALASLVEVETQLIIARRLKYLEAIEAQQNHILSLKKLCSKLIGALKPTSKLSTTTNNSQPIVNQKLKTDN